jgi:hypothetical protein
MQAANILIPVAGIQAGLSGMNQYQVRHQPYVADEHY